MKCIKTLAYAIALSFALLACSDTSANDCEAKGSKTSKASAYYKLSSASECASGVYDEAGYCKLRDEDYPPYDPNVVIIDDEVTKWIEEQFASGGSEKRQIRISEMHWEETDWDYVGGGVSARYEAGEYVYIVNGVSMNQQEYDEFMEGYWQRYYEQLKGKRDLPIPGLIGEDSVGWTALMTAGEIAELTETYKELAISFLTDPVAEGGEEAGSNGDLPLRDCSGF